MVQQFGELAGQLGLIVATVIAAFVYGIVALSFRRYVVPRLPSGLKTFEKVLVLALVVWLLFGVLVLPVSGAGPFGIFSPYSSSFSRVLFPASLLLVQGVFALALSPRFRIRPRPAEAAAAGTPEVSRREFIEKGIVGVLAIVAGAIGLTSLGSLFSSRIQPTGGSQPVDLANAPAIFRDPRLAPLVESEITPNAAFYRVAIDIIDPTVNASDWSLMVDGLVGAPKRYGLGDLSALPQTSEYSTFECVRNQINGNLISNAKWTGVRLSDLFKDAGGVQSGATYAVFYSVDGYSVGIPLAKALMDDSMMALMMNDLTLPVRHGFPLRAVIPGLYGMMSAKWVNRISLVSMTYNGYWQTRGWSNDARIYTVAFIATPSSSDRPSLSAYGGSVLIGGYAFAGDRGVSKVEVSHDGGKTWVEAQLKKPISNLTWALWAYDWHPSGPGLRYIYARATDGQGQVQTSDIADTFPNGATGYAYAPINVVQ